MGMKAECDLCHKDVQDSQDIVEVRVYPSSKAGPSTTFGAMVCEACKKALGLGEFIHKFKSMGAIDLQLRAQQTQLEQQRAAALNQPLDGPVPVDPALAHRIRNAR